MADRGEESGTPASDDPPDRRAAAAAHLAEAREHQRHGRTDAAAHHFHEAVKADPSSAPAWRGLALALAALDHPDAGLCLRRALSDAPGDAALAYRLGTLLGGQGQNAEAEAVLDRALLDNPASAALHGALADALHRQGRLSEAVAQYRAALRTIEPGDTGVRVLLINLGVAQRDLGAQQDALAALRRAVAAVPADLQALNNLGTVLTDLRRVREAERLFRRVLALRPDHGRAFDNLGVLRQACRDHGAAARFYRMAIVLDPQEAEFQANLGVLLLELDRAAEAGQAYERALRLAPEQAALHTGFGLCRQAEGRWAEAEAAHRAAVRLDGALAAGHANLGALLRQIGRDEEAEASLERALQGNANPGPTHLNLGLLRLKQGRLAEGWDGYGWRFRAKGYENRAIAAPLWQGEALDGRQLLVWREQGVGDEILFASCYPDLVERAGHLIVECDRRLAGLFARSFPKATVRPESVDLDGRESIVPADCDFHAPAGAVPCHLRGTLKHFPGRATWLVADPVRVALWRDRLAALGPGLKVGIGWRSQLMTAERKAAYTTLDQWAPLFAVPGLVFVNLQYDDCAAEMAEAEARFGLRIHRWDDLDLRDDFEGVAALISALDLVISPAMSAGELAGALGVPIWRFGARDWTQLGAGVRPWFPAMRLWQPRANETLGGVLARMARELISQEPPDMVAPIKDIRLEALPAPDLDRRLSAAIDRYRSGDLAAAEGLCGEVLERAPDHGVALHLLGSVALRQGRMEQAAGLLARAGTREPGNAAAHAGRAGALRAMGRVEEACASLRNATAAQPDAAEHWVNRTALLHSLRREGEAERDCRRALRLRPDLALAHTHRGSLMAGRGDLHGAVRCHRRALALAPAAADALTNLGNALSALDRFPEAVRLLRRAAGLSAATAPDLALTLTNLGNSLATLGQVAEAELVQQRALALAPALADAHANLGHLLRRCNRAAEAAEAYRRGLVADSRLAVAHYNLGLLRLEGGELRSGWSGHEWRFGTPQFRGQERRLAARGWRGENIAGRRILVWREQGVGDEMMFASCYPDLMGRAGHLVIECDRRLVPLFARSFPGATVRPETADPRDVDLAIAAGSLPRLLRTDLRRFPDRPSWLVADPARVALWRDRLAALDPGLKVGIGWRSQLMTAERKAAYTTLDQWAPLFAVPGLVFVNLQYDDCAAEMAEAEARFGVRIHRWDDLDLRDDFEASAALISALDLVISPAMSAGELAGALGVPVWRFGARDWTQLGAGVRPWFPAMRLWQPRVGETLGDVLARMARELTPPAGEPADAPDPDPDPDPGPAALLEQAADHHRNGRWSAAAPLYERILERHPNHPVALHLSGLLAHQAGDHEGAVARIGRAVAHLPGYGAARVNLGNALLAAGRPGAAVLHFRMALALQPAAAATLTNLGNALDAAFDDAGAALAHRRATEAEPGLAVAQDNLGAMLCRLGRPEEAERRHRRALALNHGLLSGWVNLSIALRRLGRPAAALASLDRALGLDPASGDALANRGRLLRDMGLDEAAERWCDRALAVEPGEPTAAFNMGLLRLTRGALAPGWAGYDRRFQTTAHARGARETRLPAWRGEALGGRRILVWGEQGIGDEVMFASCLPDLIDRAGHVVVECDRRLMPLFARSFPTATVRALAGPGAPVPPGLDLQAAAGSLPRWLRPDLGAFPARRAFLAADPERAAVWKHRVDALGAGLKVGIAWRSGLMTGDRLANYAPLDRWQPILTVPGVRFLTLQYGDSLAEIRQVEAAFGQPIHRWPDLDLKDDLDGLAALMSCLDLVLTPASSVGELAGALGVPVWRFGVRGDWTALGTGVRPWFPGMRLFHAGHGQTVPDLLPGIARELRRLAMGPRG